MNAPHADNMALTVGAVNSVQQQSQAVHQVTYKLTTAKGGHVSASYNQTSNGGYASASVLDTPSPWTVDTTVPGLAGPNLTGSVSPDINHPNRSDTITCTITEDGKQVAQNKATGSNASVTCTAPAA